MVGSASAAAVRQLARAATPQVSWEEAAAAAAAAAVKAEAVAANGPTVNGVASSMEEAVVARAGEVATAMASRLVVAR